MLIHNGIRAGMVPEEAIGLAVRALNEAEAQGINFRSRAEVQKFMEQYHRIARQMHELEPPKI